ncbi:MAG: sigma factor, partial [Gemmatimonadota bacterium]|nr:sigma factor [Gemmatimonadota bacterium]
MSDSAASPERSSTLPERIAKGDPAAEGELVFRYEERIRMVAAKRLPARLVEDAVQESLARVVEALREGRLRRADRLGSFVHGTALNVTRDLLRRLARERSRRGAGDPDEHRSETPSPLHRLVQAEERRRAAAALDRMRDSDREVLRSE